MYSDKDLDKDYWPHTDYGTYAMIVHSPIDYDNMSMDDARREMAKRQRLINARNAIASEEKQKELERKAEEQERKDAVNRASAKAYLLNVNRSSRGRGAVNFLENFFNNGGRSYGGPF